MPDQTHATAEPPSLTRYNLLHPIRWVPPDAGSLLDVGCNAGEFLDLCHQFYPEMRLVGVDVNDGAVEAARERLPMGEFHCTGSESLPFDDASFDCATCIEVLEHIPADLRRQALGEMRRVLRPGGRLALRVPHAGVFSFLDPNNFRFRFPGLYHRVVGRGRRDSGYDFHQGEVVWHHHFARKELLDLLGPGWHEETWRTGGLFLAPLSDIGRWPFYRAKRLDHPVFHMLSWLCNADMGVPYGAAAYDILLILRKT